jgi:hypothetical protein
MNESKVLVYLERVAIVNIGFAMGFDSKMNRRHWIPILDHIFHIRFPKFIEFEESFEKMESAIFSKHIPGTIVIIRKTSA